MKSSYQEPYQGRTLYQANEHYRVIGIDSLEKRLTFLSETLNLKPLELNLSANDGDQQMNDEENAEAVMQILSHKQYEMILEYIAAALHQAANHKDDKQAFEKVCMVLRISDPLLKDFTQYYLERSETVYLQKHLLHVYYILSCILQYTNKHNYSILKFLISNAGQQTPLCNYFLSDFRKAMTTLFRLLESQPYLLQVWNLSGLFNSELDKVASTDVHLSFLLKYLRHMAAPTNIPLAQEVDKLKTIEALEYLDSLRLIKSQEVARQQLLPKMISGTFSIQPCNSNTSEIEPQLSQKNKVMTKYLKGKMNSVLEVMEESLFQHFALCGEEGSGKMAFIELLSDSFHAVPNQEKGQPGKENNKLIVVTLEETFDSKNLVGTYVCNESGEFVFKKGPLTVAAEEGLWLVLRHIEKAPSDLLSFLLPLVQENILQVTATFSIVPKLGFRIFALCHQTQRPSEDIKPFLNHLHHVQLAKLMDFSGSNTCVLREDFENEMLPTLYPMAFSIKWLPRLLLSSVVQYLQPRLQQLKAQMLDFKALSVRQVFKTFNRVEQYLANHYKREEISNGDFYLSTNARMVIIEDLIDEYLAYIYDKELKSRIIVELVQTVWNQDAQAASLDPQSVADYVTQQTRNYGVSKSQCFFGRSMNMQIVKNEEEEQQTGNDGNTHYSKFVYTATTLRLLEQIAQAIHHQEAALLVGETGTGKTTSVQELARLLGKQLHVFNMNQNTDSADLLGGFKPVDLKFLLKPLYEKFLAVFKNEFKSLEKNKKFLDLTQKCYEENRVKEFLQCLQHGVTAVRGKKNFLVTEELLDLEHHMGEVQARANKLESGGGFIFQFIEGTLINSIKNGEWILLDEINLASESVLNRLATLIDGDYILLNERADIVQTKRHPDFRLFLCMNPPYTSAGKKQLPWSLRSKLTELYVPELDSQSDLWLIIDRNCSIPEHLKRRILEFYIAVRDQVSKQTKRGNIGLRNLSRSLAFMRAAISLKYPVLKAIYDSLYTCFASHLDEGLQKYISSLIFQLFDIKHMPQLAHSSEMTLSDKYALVEQFIIPKGNHKNGAFNPRDFVTTASFKRLLRQLAGVIAVSDYAVILQGPTSAGKTSTVQYLANVTHNKVIRINNHMHTDIQEYLGSYVPDKEGGGKLVFQEGVLVEAVRNGYWVILDELNLAPSEVLEALNRLLDDNRELLVVETQKVIKAHPNFRIFATQNPTEGYGGRKELSEAFKNRFILINVHDVPLEELVEILIYKCQLPKSRADLMVKVMEQLQIYRSQGSNLFSGKDSTITVRDLLKWASRLTHQCSTSSVMDLALEGFMVLGERARNEQDKAFIKETIEKVAKVIINERSYYREYFEKNLKLLFTDVPKKLNLPRLIPTQQLQRLAVLTHKCLLNQEPVLLVGETGCGKTTLCQVFAALGEQNLFAINCHQNTETSDFIGCMRTRKNLKQTQDQFSLEFSNFLLEISTKQLIADISPYTLPDDCSLKTLNHKFVSLTKALKSVQITSDVKQKLNSLKTLRDNLTCIFEWHDGILVEAMQNGGLLLIDEISLANDSVLERLNSVFEAERTLVISEKSSKEAVKIVGHPKFRMVATMNPSGDFGKKELSPALRNRMTEIWVESYFHQEELVSLYHSVQKPFTIFHKVEHTVDLYLIIEETAFNKLNSKIKGKEQIQKVALGIFNMIGFINFVMAQRYFVLQRKALSIRDILSIIDFIEVTIHKVFNNNILLAFRHAVSLVILDGLCLGIDVSGDKQKNDILEMCTKYLHSLERELYECDNVHMIEDNEYIEEDQFIGVRPFTLDKVEQPTQQINYAFGANTTKTNLLKLLRAYQLNKPVLIEGPPGVGKTSLVENLAKVTGRKLVRVNLSEQTDMMDLLGSEYPVSTKSTSTQAKHRDDHEDDIRFHWCDGVLLQAIKEGSWFLIDEMNLAQQSVLEGLNAILDHRRTVYIPELNREFKCHPNFFVFACQNPSSSATSVGGRKTLPKSFLNRFNKIYLEELNQKDYLSIIKKLVSTDCVLNELNVTALLNLSNKIETLIKTSNNQYQDEGAINMRDLSRFLNLYQSFMVQDKVTSGQAILQAYRICYISRISPNSHQQAYNLLIQSGLLPPVDINLIEKLDKAQIIRVDEISGTLNFISQVKPTKLQLDNRSSTRVISFKVQDYLNLKGPHSNELQFIVDCINCNIPLLLVSNKPFRLIDNLKTISKVTGQKLNRILLNERSDTAQLLGCFEQTVSDFTLIIKELERVKQNAGEANLVQQIIELEYELQACQNDHAQQAHLVRQFLHSITHLQDIHDLLHAKLHEVEHILRRGSTSRFEWVDSVLVRSIVEGEWVIFENANLCNPSILDRLNPLLEEGNTSLCINEQGLIEGDVLRNIKAHESFRSIFVISKQTFIDQGKDVSRALRNRCLQITINYDDEDMSEDVNQAGDQHVLDSRLMQIHYDLEVVSRQQEREQVTEKLDDLVSTFAGLGKRKRNLDVSNDHILKYTSSSLCALDSFLGADFSKSEKRFAKAYLHFMVSLVGPSHALTILNYVRSHYPLYVKQVDFIAKRLALSQPFQGYVQEMIYRASQVIRDFLGQRAHIVNRQTLEFLEYLVDDSTNISNEKEYMILLKNIKKCLSYKDYNSIQNFKNLYLLLHSLEFDNTADSNRVIQRALETGSSNNDSIIRSMLSERILKIKEKLNLNELMVYGANKVSQQQIQLIKKIGSQIHDLKQQPMLLCVKSMLTDGESAAFGIGLEALLHSYVILLMDEDKSFKKITLDNHKQLLDPYLLQEKLSTPYVVLVPLAQSEVIVSMSNLYPPLCYLKDLVKLERGLLVGNQNKFFKRMTMIPEQTLAFSSGSPQMLLIKQVILSNLESLYQSQLQTQKSVSSEQQHTNSSIALSLIRQVRNASRETRMRDLPSYFLCSTSMQRTIKKYLMIIKQQSDQHTVSLPLREQLQFGYTEGLVKNIRAILTEKETQIVQVKSDLLKSHLVQVYLNHNKKSPQDIENKLNNLSDSIVITNSLSKQLKSALETLFIIPLEMYRLEHLGNLEEQQRDITYRFALYHSRSKEFASQQVADVVLEISKLRDEYDRLALLRLQGEAETMLRGLLVFFSEITKCADDLIQSILRGDQQSRSINEQVNLLQTMLLRSIDQYLLHFNHFITAFLTSLQSLANAAQFFIMLKNEQVEKLQNVILDCKPVLKQHSILVSPMKDMKRIPSMHRLLEVYLKYLLRYSRNIEQQNKSKLIKSVALDHFVHREVARKMQEEEQLASMEELVYRLPFKMKVQSLMEDNKAMDEWTKEDKERMEREAKLEIEQVFPSYFDDFQRVVFSGKVDDQSMDKSEKKEDVNVETILKELLSFSQSNDINNQKRSLVKMRVRMLYELLSSSPIGTQDVEISKTMLKELSNYLREDLTQSTLPSVMNVSEVRLASEYNFYHDPLPQEARLIYEPLSKLIQRIEKILSEYDTPILQDAIFLANYMLTSFSPKTAPLMKLLTGLELLLNKLEEWEVYASRSLNSCDPEMTLLKQLIIRYRKIQILSWRNLLQWRRDHMIREDYKENFVRLAHTLERQVFDKQYYSSTTVASSKEKKVEFKVMEVLDLFLRDSNLGQFEQRLSFLQLLLKHFMLKQQQFENLTTPHNKNIFFIGQRELGIQLLDTKIGKYSTQTKQAMQERLANVINVMHFVCGYYSQFKDKLSSTLARLDAAARDKVKTLIDVSKWTVQKFQQVKNNIDKRHRQLNKSCKQEEEALMQNVSHLVLTSSRKKYVQKDEGLAGLQNENKILSLNNQDMYEVPVHFYRMPESVALIINQMSLLERRVLEPMWPDCMAVEANVCTLFERLKIVRDINKRHIQRRAFIDLQKYLKEQGLQHNFQSEIQPMIMETKVVSFKNSQFYFTNDQLNGNDFKKYYMRSHELLMMLENASEAENASSEHLRNVEIIRVRGFSQSLILKILQMNKCLEHAKKQYKGFALLNQDASSFINSTLAKEDQESLDLKQRVIYSQQSSRAYQQIAIDFSVLCNNIVDSITILELVDNSSQKLFTSVLVKAKKYGTESRTKRVISHYEVILLQSRMNELRSELEMIITQITDDSFERVKSVVVDCYLPQLSQIQQQLSQLFISEEQTGVHSESVEKLQKRVKLLQKKSQLFVQDIVKAMEALYEAEKQKRRDSAITDGAGSTHDAGSVKGGVTSGVMVSDDIGAKEQKESNEDERIELTIKQYQEFSEKLQKECLNKHLPDLQMLAEKIFSFKGITCQQTIFSIILCIQSDDSMVSSSMILASQLLAKITNLIKFVIENQYIYLRSLAKFSFITQRIFIYLIFEGFCGQEDKEEEDQQEQQNEDDDKYFENDGMGMGDGKGGKENVSNQIEHEEQLEGLKNYESDQEKEQKEEKEEKNQEDEEGGDNDFEMENDFDGDLEDKPDDKNEEEDKQDKESDEDDALDKVDDMLDNKLWNEQMEDLEKREQEEDEKKNDDKPKEDIDLGKRDLDKENQLKKQDKEMTAGDHDKQESSDDEQQQRNDEDQDMQAKLDEEQEDEKQGEEEEKEEQEMEGQDIPLDRDPNVVEDVKEDENKEEEEEQEDEDMQDQEKSFSIENEGEENSNDEECYSDQHDDEELEGSNIPDEENDNDEYQKDTKNPQMQDDSLQPELLEEKQNDKAEQSLKKPKDSNLNQQQKSKQAQQNQANVDQDQSQFDVQGSDILYQMSQRLKQPKPQQPPSQAEQQNHHKPEPKKDELPSVEQPQMNPEQQQDPSQQQQPEQQPGEEAMEYEYDEREEAEQLQGKLATDKVEQEMRLQVPDENQDEDQVMQENDEEEKGERQKTETEMKLNQQMQLKATDAKQQDGGEESEKKERNDDEQMNEEESQDEKRELIDEYQEYLLKHQQQLSELMMDVSQEDQKSSNLRQYFIQNEILEEFDYQLSRQHIRDLFQQWQSDSSRVQESQQLLSRFKQETATSAASLCEQLRIVLEPQLSQSLQGDYKTGKRLNMKKVISFIASHYRNDKIWLRRTLPSKRDYRILLAIDDTLSMKEGGLGFFSLEALTTITEALHRLEVGKVAVAAIRDRMELLQSFEDGGSISNERTAFALSQFTFNYSAPKSADLAMANFVKDANQMLDISAASSGDSLNLPFVIVLSDGRFNKNNVRQYLSEAREKRYLYIFVILDTVKKVDKSSTPANKSKQSDGSILSMKSVEKDENGGIKLVPYLKDFPFEYYCIVRDVHQLPAALGSILVQWFSLINNSGA